MQTFLFEKKNFGLLEMGERMPALPRYIYIENREISQERLDGFSISLAQKKRNSKIQMSDLAIFEFRKIDKVMSDLVTKIGLKRTFLTLLSWK